MESPRRDKGPAAYVLIRVKCDRLQDCRDSLIKDRNLLASYQGEVVGIGREISTLEGFWEDGMTLVLLLFKNMTYAEMWYHMTPSVRQGDWLGGVDIIAAPLTKSHCRGKNFATMVDIEFTDPQRYFGDFVPVATEIFEKVGGTGDVVRAKEGEYKVLRGGWRPRVLALHLWDSMEQLNRFYNDPEYLKVRSIRETTSNSHTVVFSLSSTKTVPNFTIDEATKAAHKRETGMK